MAQLTSNRRQRKFDSDMRIFEITTAKASKPVKPLTPDKARIESLKQQKERASDALKAERERQKIHKAQQNIGKAMTPHL